ncbi:MAG: TldD/PmbA family protein, partial [Candidatus Heimdallarchaeaceae archaeon]
MFSENFNSLIEYAIKALESKGFSSYEISCIDRLHSLTRYANSTIHQNVSDHTYRFIFRAAEGKKLSSISLSSLTETSIDSSIEQLKSMLSFVPEIPFFQGFTEKTDATIENINSTNNLLDEFQRADIVETAIGEAERVDKNVKLAGAVHTTDLRFRIINSNDIDLSHRITYNGLVVNALTEKESKGYAKEEQYVRDPSELNPVDLARKATELSVNTCFSKDYSPGEYEVILSPSATTTLMRFLSFGFGGTGYHEGQSFITDQIGSQLFDKNLTLLDDPLNPETLLASPVDGEGVWKKPSFIVEEGIPKTVIYNSFIASRYLNNKEETTGHQIIPYSDYVFGGVMPLNLVLYPGDSSVPEMIEETKKGFYINRLHYTNFVNRKLGAITGLTRDGILYIEDGEVVSAAKNFRFTDKLTECLKDVPLISKEVEKGIT